MFRINTVQGAIGLYYAEHGKYPGYDPGSGAPDDAGFTKQLLLYSDRAGKTQATFGSPFIYGPYLRPPFPENPINKLNTVKVIATPAGAFSVGASGWVAVLSNGDFRINTSEAELESLAKIDLGKAGAEGL